MNITELEKMKKCPLTFVRQTKPLPKLEPWQEQFLQAQRYKNSAKIAASMRAVQQKNTIRLYAVIATFSVLAVSVVALFWGLTS